jgi:acetolactate synthase I/III small subunit
LQPEVEVPPSIDLFFAGGASCSISSTQWNSMRHVLSALVMNQPGVLAHISGMLASRAFNIDSLAVGATENPRFSRITFVVNGNDRVLDQVRKQLEKIVTVVKVLDFSGQDYVERDLMLMKVSTKDGSRSQIKELSEIFRARIVDVSPEHVMIEISGRESKIEAFIEQMRPFGILEIVRTGRVAMLRDDAFTVDAASDRPPTAEQDSTIPQDSEKK